MITNKKSMNRTIKKNQKTFEHDSMKQCYVTLIRSSEHACSRTDKKSRKISTNT